MNWCVENAQHAVWEQEFVIARNTGEIILNSNVDSAAMWRNGSAGGLHISARTAIQNRTRASI